MMKCLPKYRVLIKYSSGSCSSLYGNQEKAKQQNKPPPLKKQMPSSNKQTKKCPPTKRNKQNHKKNPKQKTTTKISKLKKKSPKHFWISLILESLYIILNPDKRRRRVLPIFCRHRFCLRVAVFSDRFFGSVFVKE